MSGTNASVKRDIVLQGRRVVKTYVTPAGPQRVLDGIDFDVKAGEFVCIAGPSGAGKTTLLRTLAQLQSRDSGEVLVDGEVVTSPPQQMAVVFQDYSRSLLPWATVARNVALPLSSRNVSASEKEALIADALESVGLSSARDKYPWQLSGGMQQRVAIARALAYRPEVLLMDEPFASVDAQTRFELEDLMLQMRDRYGMSVVLVTHDVDEAVYLADRIFVLSGAPAKIIDTISVDLGAVRDQIMTRADERFVEYRARLLALIRAQSAPRQVPSR